MSGGGDKEVDRIFVGGLPPHANEAEVEDIFAKYGRIEQIQIRRKAAGGLPFAFVRFASPRSVEFLFSYFLFLFLIALIIIVFSPFF